MKTILLWDLRFPANKPVRLTLDDAVASAAVRSGAAAAADPAQSGALNAGGPLDPGMLTEVVLQHGVNGTAMSRVFLPYSVVLVGAAAGVLASIGTPIASTLTPTPTITISGAQSKSEGNSGATLYTYTVTRSTAIGAVLVPWSFTAGGTDATDYTGGTLPAGGNVSMADGVLTGSIVISVNGDAVVEGDETFTVLISTPSGYVAGAATSATGTILNDDVAGTPSAGFTLTQLPYPKKNYQRTTTSGGGQGFGAGTIAHAINVTTPGTIYARVRSSDGTTILQASRLIGTVAATGAQTFNVTGIDTRLGWFYVDLSGDGVTWTNGTVQVGMGGVIGLSGQSLAVRMLVRLDSESATLASLGITASPYGTIYATYVDTQKTFTAITGYDTPKDGGNYSAASSAELLNRMITMTGFNWSLVGHARGNTSMTVFLSGGSEHDQLMANLDVAGGFEEYISMQGHSDAGLGVSATTFQGYLSSLFGDLATRNAARGTTFNKLVGTIPNISATSYGTFAQKQVIRKAAADWCASNSATYVDMRDLKLVADGVHPGMIGGVTMSQHFYRAARPSYGAAHNDNGPTITSVARANGSASLALIINLPSGATALSSVGSPATRFSVFNAGDVSTKLALDATTPITISGSTITLLLASAPADSTALDVYFSASPDPVADGSASMIYDNNVDGDGITTGRQIVATLAPATAAAPTVVAPTNSVAPTVGGSAIVGQTLTTTNGSWNFYPTSYAYQWRYVDTSANIAGATSNSYVLTSADIGHTVACVVSAINSAAPSGVAQASNTTSAVLATAPANVGPTLTITGTPTFQTGQTGFGQERVTDGVGTSLTKSDMISPSNVWTVEGFISISASPASSKTAAGQIKKVSINCGTTGRLVVPVWATTQADVYLGGGNAAGSGNTNGQINDGLRHHFRVVSNGSNGMTISVDGVQTGSTTAVADASGATTSFFGLGAQGGNSGSLWPGAIDEFAVWDIALPSSYAVPTAPYTGHENGLRSLYHLDGDFAAAAR